MFQYFYISVSKRGTEKIEIKHPVRSYFEISEIALSSTTEEVHNFENILEISILSWKHAYYYTQNFYFPLSISLLHFQSRKPRQHFADLCVKVGNRKFYCHKVRLGDLPIFWNYSRAPIYRAPRYT